MDQWIQSIDVSFLIQKNSNLQDGLIMMDRSEAQLSILREVKSITMNQFIVITENIFQSIY